MFLPDSGRGMGIHVMAGKGAGKSRLLGRTLAWQDFTRGIPLVLIDPMGVGIDNFLDKLTRLPRRQQEVAWKRVRYVEVSGSGGYVVPMPLYFRRGRENLYTVSQRVLECFKRLDPQLATASIQGWNALWRLGTAVGMTLAATNAQISEAEAVLREPALWRARLPATPELAPTQAALAEMDRWTSREQQLQSGAFRTKIGLFLYDPTMRAMFATNRPGIDWAQVIARRQAVLIDFRNERDTERLRFKMLWIYRDLLDYLQARGSGRHRPLSLIIDEITFLLNEATMHGDLLAADLEQLINVLARNLSIWLTLCHQELYQVSPAVQKALLTMGTQIFGVSTDMDSARVLARRFFPYDPLWIKRSEPVYQMGIFTHDRTAEFSLAEQEEQCAREFLQLRAFQYLVGVSTQEGQMPTELHPVSTAAVDAGQWVNGPVVAQTRASLARRDGYAEADLLAEIAQRAHPQPSTETPLITDEAHASLPATPRRTRRRG